MRRRMYQSNLHDLYYSLIHGGVSAIDNYVRNGGSLGITGPDRKSLLIGCIEEQQESVFYRCLELKVDPEVSDDMGMTALHWAVDRGMGGCVKALLSHGVNFDKKDKEGRTALMFAAYSEDTEIVEQLLESRCNVNSRNEDGYTPLHISAQQMKLKTVKLLLKNGADTFLRTDKGDSPITLALCNKDLKTVQTILEHNGRTCEGTMYSPDIFVALQRRYSDAVAMLLSYGVDPFPSEDCSKWIDTMISSSSRRLRECLISEYGYFTSSGQQNKLMLHIYKNHLFLQCFSLLKLMFLYGFQLHGTDDMLNCKERCMCRKIIADIQKLTNYQSPGSLKTLCRNEIRVCLGLGVVKKIKTLPLPNRMKRYLCFTGEFCLEKSPI